MGKAINETNDTKQHIEAFWKGWFSVFQPLYGNLLELPDLERGFECDSEALAGDWQHIGNDLKWAMGQIPDGR